MKKIKNKTNFLKIKNFTIENNVFLAPMAGITDLPFRILCKNQNCGMVYTEMVSAKGLLYDNEKTSCLLQIDEREHPIGAQLFGSDPKILAEMAKRVEELPVDIIDINMGCPALKITRNGEGSALMQNPSLIGEIVYAVARSIQKPLTIKIRKGYHDTIINAVEIAQIAQEAGVSAIAVHGRTREQFYSGKADWDIIKKVKEAVLVPVIGNGDIASPQDAKKMIDETGCDAIMIGRAARGNPWIFKRVTHYLQTGQVLPEPTIEERIDTAIDHARMILQYKGSYIGIRQMRAHLAWYIKGLPKASEMRTIINKIEDLKELERVLAEYGKNLRY